MKIEICQKNPDKPNENCPIHTKKAYIVVPTWHAPDSDNDALASVGQVLNEFFFFFKQKAKSTRL